MAMSHNKAKRMTFTERVVGLFEGWTQADFDHEREKVNSDMLRERVLKSRSKWEGSKTDVH